MAKHPILFMVFVLFMGLLGYYQYHGHLPWSSQDPQPANTHTEQSAPSDLPSEGQE